MRFKNLIFSSELSSNSITSSQSIIIFLTLRHFLCQRLFNFSTKKKLPRKLIPNGSATCKSISNNVQLFICQGCIKNNRQKLLSIQIATQTKSYIDYTYFNYSTNHTVAFNFKWLNKTNFKAALE